MTSAAVSVRGLTRRFGEVVAVEGLSFEVKTGELFGIVGPDGAGKTTTLRMLAGVMRPSGGDALIRGRSVVSEPEAVKPHIAYMSQRFGLYEDLTVGENIAFYAELYEVPRSVLPGRLERLYEFSQLAPFEGRLAGDLSGGMKQKLGLCCALVHEPDVLLLDEPTFGVDPISRRDLWLIVHDMVARGTTVIVSTAYMEEAERCDRVALMNRGRLVGLDHPRRLHEGLGGEVISVRVSEPRRAVEWLAGVPHVRSAALLGDSMRIMLGDGEEAWSSVRTSLEEQGIAVLEAAPARPSLEDVFVELVERERSGKNPERSGND